MGNRLKWYDAHLIEFQKIAHIRGMGAYLAWHKRSLEDRDAFWSEKAREYLSWVREWNSVLRYEEDEARVEWFQGGVLNASFNCLDRHLDRSSDKIAYFWEGDDPSDRSEITYGRLHDLVNRIAGALKSAGIGKGDRVVVYMPAIPELPAAMLACARIGAVHCVVNVRFSTEWLADRIRDCEAKAVITADGYFRSSKKILLKEGVDEALATCPEVGSVLVFDRCGLSEQSRNPRDIFWKDVLRGASTAPVIEPEPMAAEDPLFIMFTGVAIGKPRPLVYTHGGYLLWAAMGQKLVFDLREDDVFWSTADISWITGHTMSVYGPLLNCVTSVLYEGVAGYPDLGRHEDVISRYGVSKFCADATTIRILASNEDYPTKEDIPSLKLLGSCGDPLPWEIWEWYYRRMGKERRPIICSWWQAESGGPLLTWFPGTGPIKPGCAGLPFFGVNPMVLDLDTGAETKFPNQEGTLMISGPWPGMARTVYGDHDTYRESYSSPFSGMFITGEAARKDEDGFFWVSGRIDDLITVEGHTIGAWELETALARHPGVAEATVVGCHDKIKGQGLYAFIAVKSSFEKTDALKSELTAFLIQKIGDMARLDCVQWAEALPRTRSGKILRRLLQKIAEGQVYDLGDTTTVANPEVLDGLVRDRLMIAD